MKKLLLLILLFVSSYTFSQTWNQVGTAQFTNDGANVALALDVSGLPYVVYTDTAIDGMVHVMKFDGTNWVEIGSNVSPGIVPVKLAIAINPITGQPWIAYKDTSTNREVVKKFDGTNWVLDTADVFGFEPLSKVQLKFAANGDATIAATNTHSLQYRETLIVKRKNNGQANWNSGDLSTIVTSRNFDLITANKIAFGGTGTSSSEKIYILQYVQASGVWGNIYSSNVTTTYNDGVMASDINKIIYNKHNGGNPLLTGQNGISNPPNNQNTKERVHQLIYNSHNNNNYAFYIQSNNALRVVENNFYSNTWTDLSPGLTMQANSSAKLELNATGDKLFIAYMDNNKVSLKSYSITLPLAVVHVDVNATGANDGSSWSDAFTDIQSGIDAITPGFSKLWVAQGIYVTGSIRTDTFLITDIIQMYGGFNGTETNLTQRDPSANPTILSGDLNADDNSVLTDVEGTRQDNAYHVVTLKGNFGTGGLIDGFTISGGNANGGTNVSCSTPQPQQYHHRRGGAIYANPDAGSRQVNMAFNNCVLEKNTALEIAVYYTFSPCGGSGTTSDIDFTNCIVRDNYSVTFPVIMYNASGTYNNRRKGSLINCLIYNNESVNDASVIQLSASGGNGSANDVDIINTTITKNISGINKTIKMSNVGYSKIENSIIFNNGGFQPIDITGNATISNNNIIQGAQLGSSPSDPSFTDSANDDFTLQTSSPAIDTGDNSKIPAGIIVDLLGNVRIHNITVDMGCYEFGTTLSAEDFNQGNLQITLYPNPAKNTLNISIETELETVEIYTVLGQKVIESNTKKIHIANLTNGVYFIKIKDTKGNIATKRFIKQ